MASARQAPYFACLRVWGWPNGLDHNSRIRVSSILVLVVQVLREFAVEDFFSYKSRKRRIFFLQTSYIKDTYVEAYEFRQAWSVATRRGRGKKEKKRKRPRKARRWLHEGKVPCALHQEFLFLVHKYLGSERPVSFEYRLLRDLVYKEAMCEGSSGNGQLYAAKAVP